MLKTRLLRRIVQTTAPRNDDNRINMKLKQLLLALDKKRFADYPLDVDIASICCDSRQVSKDSLFVAVDGEKEKGSRFIDAAIAKGACCVITSGGRPVTLEREVPVITFPDTRVAVARLADEFFGHPSEKLKVIGVTGTNGKTTVTYLIKSIAEKAGFSSGLIGTINYLIKDKVIPAVNTTPGALQLQHLLKQMVDNGCKWCVMEASSHGIEQDRAANIDFTAAVFTNLTQDHLDYHHNLENYFLAKAKLFSGLSGGAYAIINADSPYSLRLKSLTKAKCITYAIDSFADVKGSDLILSLEGSKFIVESESFKLKLKTGLIGRHNISNILAACALAASQKINPEAIKEGIENFPAVRGRLEKVIQSEKFNVFIDYAHTPDALENVLKILRQWTPKKLILVFGCGGDRDRLKRPLMGSCAEKYADWTVITSDNPRGEVPSLIADEIVKGMKGKNHKIVLSRKEAIDYALARAKAQDTVLVAGKGHENYQIFADRKIDFDDRQVVEEWLIKKQISI